MINRIHRRAVPDKTVKEVAAASVAEDPPMERCASERPTDRLMRIGQRPSAAGRQGCDSIGGGAPASALSAANITGGGAPQYDTASALSSAKIAGGGAPQHDKFASNNALDVGGKLDCQSVPCTTFAVWFHSETFATRAKETAHVAHSWPRQRRFIKGGLGAEGAGSSTGSKQNTRNRWQDVQAATTAIGEACKGRHARTRIAACSSCCSSRRSSNNSRSSSSSSYNRYNSREGNQQWQARASKQEQVHGQQQQGMHFPTAGIDAQLKCKDGQSIRLGRSRVCRHGFEPHSLSAWLN